MKKRAFVTVVVAGSVFRLLGFTACAPENTLTDDFEQIIPRGAIAAVNDPNYVGAEDAKIGDDSFVLGVLIDGQARAYSLNLLNAHEVVNDEIGETKFAAVW